MTPNEQLQAARKVFQALLNDPRSYTLFDTTADDPEHPYYWEIDHTQIEALAEALGVPIPESKQP